MIAVNTQFRKGQEDEPAASYRDGRFHKIEVRIAARPELKVRTRKGYFAPSEKNGDLAEKPPDNHKEDNRKEDKRKEKSPEKIAQQEGLILEPGVAERIAEQKRAIPRDCLGVLYDLSFEGREISLEAVEELLGPAADYTVR